MAPHIFIISICTYLFCLVSALLLSFFRKHISITVIWIFSSLHILSGLLYLGYRYIFIGDPASSGLFFLGFFCSGILVGGMILRKKILIWIKIYFSVFLLSVVFFVISPARLLGFISSGNINEIHPNRIHLKENYYFVEQELGNKGQVSEVRYKLVMEMGVFHRTIARDIYFPRQMDSIRMISFKKGDKADLMIYFKQNNKYDSLLLSLPLKAYKDSAKIITRKP